VVQLPPIVVSHTQYTTTKWKKSLVTYELVSKFTDPSDPTHSSLQQMYAQAQPNGYWTGADPDAVQHNFEPGVYTIVAGDEWGALVILHFTVAQ
jgi:hypothetical protein